MNEDTSAERQRAMMDIVPTHWDKAPLLLAHEIRSFLNSVRDEGTSIDSGGSDGTGDLWVMVQGIEYFVSIRKSNYQLIAEGKPIP